MAIEFCNSFPSMWILNVLQLLKKFFCFFALLHFRRAVGANHLGGGNAIVPSVADGNCVPLGNRALIGDGFQVLDAVECVASYVYHAFGDCNIF